MRLNQQSSGELCLEIYLHPVGIRTIVERDGISLQKSDWCEKRETGTTITFLELKLHIQSSLNWPKTDLGYHAFSQTGKQIKSIVSGWSSSTKQLGREPDELVWGQGRGQAEGQHITVLVPSVKLVRPAHPSTTVKPPGQMAVQTPRQIHPG